MATVKTEATLEDLYTAATEEGKYELVRGELVYMPPNGYEHHYIGSDILFYLKLYQRETNTGVALMDNVEYVARLPHRRSFSPDVSYTLGLPPVTPRFIEGSPLFAVEIRSPGDYGPKMDAAYAEKRADYFAAGTVTVWDVDPQARTIRSYRTDAPDTPAEFRDGDEAHAEPALPGWRVPVRDLFPPRQEPAM